MSDDTKSLLLVVAVFILFLIGVLAICLILIGLGKLGAPL